MKNIKTFYTLILLVLPFIFASCEDIIDVKLNSVEPNIVIEANVRMDSLATVKITTARDFSSTNSYLSVKDAVVNISDNAGNAETLQFNEDADCYVANNIKGVQRRIYNLSVTYKGNEYTSTSQMPTMIAIDSLTLFEFPMIDYRTPMVHYTDPKGSENDFYRFIIFVNGKRPVNEYNLISTEIVDGFPIHQRLNVPHKANSTEDPVVNGDTLTVEMQCLDKGAYTFWETLFMIGNSLNNPTNNIKGGALGYFSAYSHDTKSIHAIW